MRQLFLPLHHSLRNRFFPGGKPSMRTIGLFLFGTALAVALFAVSLRVVGYFHRQNELGIILSMKIFQMAWTILLAMLIFSSMVSGVSALFLSKDNEVLFTAPVAPRQLYLMRYLTTMLYTSWMMVVFSFPVFSAFGWLFKAGYLFTPLLLLASLSTAAIANGIGLCTIILLVRFFPARRTRDIAFYLSLLFSILLFLVFRLIRPEDLADPDKFPDFMEYLGTLQTPASPLIPSSWASGLLLEFMRDHQVDWLLIGLLLLTPLVLYYLGQHLMERLFFSGFSKAQESFGGYRSFRRIRYRPAAFSWFARKELKMFIRDSSEWSQLFLIAALVVIYLYNFKVLPLERSPMPVVYLSNLIAYANIGLTGFLIASLAARFVYPSIGMEGEGFGLIRTAPLSLRRYMIYKYLFYTIPFVILAATLLIASNHLLQITGPMQWISLITGIILTLSVVGMALGFGAVHADFTLENRAAVQGSFGAILFLFCALAFELFVIALGSAPAYKLTRIWIRTGEIASWHLVTYGILLIGIIVCALLVAVWTMYRGIRHLSGKTQ